MDDVSDLLLWCCRGDYEAELQSSSIFKYVVISLVKYGYRWLTDIARVKSAMRWTASGLVQTRSFDVTIEKTALDPYGTQPNKRAKVDGEGDRRRIERWPVYDPQRPMLSPANAMWSLVSYNDMDPMFG
jgi:hypothetical protein